MTTTTAELIDIDFLWFLADEAIDEPICDGDLVSFNHPRRGYVVALQSGKLDMLIQGGFQDLRGLPATASVLPLDIAPHAAPRPLQESSGVVAAFPAR